MARLKTKTIDMTTSKFNTNEIAAIIKLHPESKISAIRLDIKAKTGITVPAFQIRRVAAIRGYPLVPIADRVGRASKRDGHVLVADDSKFNILGRW